MTESHFQTPFLFGNVGARRTLALEAAPHHLRRDGSAPDGVAKHHLVELRSAPSFTAASMADSPVVGTDSRTAARLVKTTPSSPR